MTSAAERIMQALVSAPTLEAAAKTAFSSSCNAPGSFRYFILGKMPALLTEAKTPADLDDLRRALEYAHRYSSRSDLYHIKKESKAWYDLVVACQKRLWETQP